ncbi:MAG TPA: STAS/SEC14 domain-containing protein [Blastocatellia bacterium]|nr:STAS/SEC14 domain-containing protein [Blastocatellia bacterium]
MATRTAVIPVEPDLADAFNAAPKTRKMQALSAMRQVLNPAKRRKVKVLRLSKKETELFLKINRTLPEDKQQRYDELTEKRFEETLTKREHAELLRLIEELEQIWIGRWQAVIDLAKLRKIAPREMMRQLGVDPDNYG